MSKRETKVVVLLNAWQSWLCNVVFGKKRALMETRLDWHCEWLKGNRSLFDLAVSLCPSVSSDKAPHFSRLGDEEVNAGQNASFQCVAAGRASEAEKFLLEVSGLMLESPRVCLPLFCLCYIFISKTAAGEAAEKKNGVSKFCTAPTEFSLI